MAIAAQRFQFLDRETHVAMTTFSSSLDSAVLNAASGISEPSETLSEMIASATESPLEDQIPVDTIEDFMRSAKDLKGQVLDVANMPAAMANEFLSDITGGNAAAMKSIKGIMDKCSVRGLNNGMPGKPFDFSMNCGAGDISLGKPGGAQGCDAFSFNNLLGKLTGGGYGAAFSDLNKAMQKMMSLAGYGYNMGMCGVFSALSGGLPTDALSKAAGGLLGSVGAAGNINGFLDIAKSSTGLSPLLHAPSGISGMLNNFKLPSNIMDSGLVGMADRTLGGLELLDEDWASSAFDSMPSISDADVFCEDLGDVIGAKLTDRSFSITDLDAPPSNDMDFIMGSYSMSGDDDRSVDDIYYSNADNWDW